MCVRANIIIIMIHSFLTTTTAVLAVIFLLGICASSSSEAASLEMSVADPIALVPIAIEPVYNRAVTEKIVREVLGKILRETFGTLVNSGGKLGDTLIEMHQHASSFVTQIQLNATFGHSKAIGQKVLAQLRMAFYASPFGRHITEAYTILADYMNREVAAPYAEYQRGIEKLIKVATLQFGQMIDKLSHDLRISPTGDSSQET